MLGRLGSTLADHEPSAKVVLLANHSSAVVIVTMPKAHTMSKAHGPYVPRDEIDAVAGALGRNGEMTEYNSQYDTVRFGGFAPRRLIGKDNVETVFAAASASRKAIQPTIDQDNPALLSVSSNACLYENPDGVLHG